MPLLYGDDTVSASGYVCPMHPDVTASEPAKCPQCGMKLVPSDAAAVPVSQPTERTGHGGHAHGDGLEWEDLMPEINRASDPSNMIWQPATTSCSQRRTRLVEARALPQLAGRGCRAEVGTHPVPGPEEPGYKPLTVVTAAKDAQEGWMPLQDEMLNLSSNSVHRVIQNATHTSLNEDKPNRESPARPSSSSSTRFVPAPL
jgi:hypothetical protein